MKFTDRSVAALKNKNARYEVWEENGHGFGIRVGSRLKTWIYMYRFKGKARRMSLGVYPMMSLASAHEAFAVARRKLAQGIDPGEERQIGIHEVRNANSIAELAALYKEKHVKVNNRASWEREVCRILEKDIIPAWGNRTILEIKRRDVAELLDAVRKRGATTTCNRTLAVISKMFSFAIGEGLLEYNPCAGVNKPFPEKPRDRVLAPEEIKSLWNADFGKGQLSHLGLKLILVTATRPIEVSGAPWDEFDLDKRIWTLPPIRAKNEHELLIPLSDLAISILEEIKNYSGESPYLLPSARDKGKPINSSSVFSHALFRRFRDKDSALFGMKRFSARDLRRTAATLLTQNGIPNFIVGRILNHVEPGVTSKHYDKHSYFPEKKAALELLGRLIISIVNPT